MATSCACIIVSKLKPVPFHKVNSPLLDAVSNLRPSGVHRTTLTGCLILFSEECRCRAGTESTGLWILANGGSICLKLGCGRSAWKEGAYIDNVAGARPFHFPLVASFVPRLTVSHPVDQGRAVVRNRTCRILSTGALFSPKTQREYGETEEGNASGDVQQTKVLN
jgi:hypothetical protein